MSQIWLNLSHPHGVCAEYFPLRCTVSFSETDWYELYQKPPLPSGFWLDLAIDMHQQETGGGWWVRYKSPRYFAGCLLRLTASVDWRSQTPVRWPSGSGFFGNCSSPDWTDLGAVASGFQLLLWFPTPCPHLCKMPFVSCQDPDWYNGVNEITAAIETWSSLSEVWS